MAEIKPFRGIRYHWEKLNKQQMEDLVAPPYDVIDQAQQQQLYERDPANFVRLDLNRIKNSDNGDDNRYERARRHLFDWLAEGRMTVDRDPTIYTHEQTFEDEAGDTNDRRGFIGLVRLADYEDRVVLPHERTLRGPKQDRLELMKATECNLSQIFFLYDDPHGEVDDVLFSDVDGGQSPMVDIETDDGIDHRLWSVVDQQKHRRVAELLADSPLLIADGHHRYETALAYRNFRRRVDEQPPPNAPYEYVMGFFVNMHDPGLRIFPIHRVVHGLHDFDFDELADELDESPHFTTEPMGAEALDDPISLRRQLERAGDDQPAFGAVDPAGHRGLWIRFATDVDAPFFADDTPESVRRLDVSVLHEGILEPMLDIDREAQRAGTHLRYVKSWSKARNALDHRKTQVVFFMNPTRVSQVNDVCLSGGKMPQKSTYFYPKILSGLVVNPL